MLEREYRVPNTLGPNDLTDDKTMLNYLALAKCITGVKINGSIKYPSISQACSAYKLYCDLGLEDKVKQDTKEIKPTKKIKHNKRLKILATNVKTGKSTLCHGNGEVELLTGIPAGSVANYCNNGFAYKKTWKLSRVGKKEGSSNAKHVRLTNLKNGEVKEITGLNNVGKFFNRSPVTVGIYLRKDGVYKGWKIEYID